MTLQGHVTADGKQTANVARYNEKQRLRHVPHATGAAFCCDECDRLLWGKQGGWTDTAETDYCRACYNKLKNENKLEKTIFSECNYISFVDYGKEWMAVVSREMQLSRKAVSNVATLVSNAAFRDKRDLASETSFSRVFAHALSWYQSSKGVKFHRYTNFLAESGLIVQ